MRWKESVLCFGLAIVTATALAAQPPGAGGGPWQMLSEHFDMDEDGEITADEYSGRRDFTQMDRNQDGVLTEADFEGRSGKRGQHGARGGRMLMHLADDDGDGEISAAEWQGLVQALDADADGVISEEEIGALRPQREQRGERDREQRGERDRERQHRSEGRRGGQHPMGRMLDIDRDGVLEAEDFDALFTKLDANGDQTLDSTELPQPGRRRFEGAPQ